MLYYLCSTLLSVLKINGEYKGECDCNLSTVYADENAYFEFLPFDNDYAPSCFKINLDAQLLESNYRSYPFEKGTLFMPIFTKKYMPFYKCLFNFNLNDCFIQIFIDGHSKLFVTNKYGSNLFSLPFIPLQCDAQILDCLLLLTLKSKDKQLLVCVDLSKAPVLKFIKEIKNISIEKNGFSTTQTPNALSGICIYEKHSVTGEVLSKNITRNRPIERLNDYLIPFSFLEEVLFDGVFSDYLHPNLLPHANLVKTFLGNFLSFIPYVKDDKINALLISENKARQINFTLEQNKILDFTEV